MTPNRKDKIVLSQSGNSKGKSAERAAWITGKSAMIAAGITAAGAILAAVLAMHVHRGPKIPPPEKKFVGRVSDKTTGKPVKGAQVSLEYYGVPKIEYTDTDSEGVFSLPLIDVNNEVRVRIKLTGYKNYDRLIFPAQHSGMREIQIEPVTIESIRSSPTSAPPSPPQVTLFAITEEENSKYSSIGCDHRSPLSHILRADVVIINVTDGLQNQATLFLFLAVNLRVNRRATARKPRVQRATAAQTRMPGTKL